MAHGRPRCVTGVRENVGRRLGGKDFYAAVDSLRRFVLIPWKMVDFLFATRKPLDFVRNLLLWVPKSSKSEKLGAVKPPTRLPFFLWSLNAGKVTVRKMQGNRN